MNRRGLFGALTGGAIAGPSMAKGLVGQVVGSSGLNVPRPAYSYNSIGSASATETAVGYAARNLKEHRRKAAEMKRERAVEMRREFDEADVSSLRSVSPRHKIRMLIERRVERDHAIQEGWLLRMLREAEEGAA